MDLRWQEEQRAFQARILVDENPDIALRPYRTFVGRATIDTDRRATRLERLTVTVITVGVLVALLMAFGVSREFTALVAGLSGGAALVLAVSPSPVARRDHEWVPLLAVFAPSVLRGAPPVCVTRISLDEFDRLGTEGFGTVVGNPAPGATFGLFVDDHLVWPRTPPRAPHHRDPGFGAT